jgi:hypothetical protein
MKRTSLFLITLMLIVLVSALAADQAGAEPNFPASKMTETICSRGAPETLRFEEKYAYGLNMPQTMKMSSSDPRFIGDGDNMVNWYVNFRTMKGASWGDVEYYNANGTDGWIGNWLGSLYPSTTTTGDGMPIWLFDGHGQARGLGKYQGLRIHTEIHQSVFVYPSEPEALQEVPCVTGLTGNDLYEVYVLQNDITAHVTGHADD